MQAAVYHGRRDVRVEAVPDPGDPGRGEVLVAVARAAICGTDASEYSHGPILIPLRRPHPSTSAIRPVVLGHEFTGTVVAAGAGVDGIVAGERVVSGAGVSCGDCRACLAGRTNLCDRYYTLGLQADGGLAELVLAPAATCVRVPHSCPDDAAAMAQPLAVALHAVRRGRVEAGDAVAVIGVGGIGAFVVAAAKARDAAPLVAVDVVDARLEAALRLGADAVVDARCGQASDAILELTGGAGADVVVEASGVSGAAAEALAAARAGGRVVSLGLPKGPQELDVAGAALREVELLGTVAHVCGVDLPEAVELLATSDLASLVLDRVIPLESVVEDGLEALASGRAHGKVVVDPSG